MCVSADIGTAENTLTATFANDTAILSYLKAQVPQQPLKTTNPQYLDDLEI